MRLRQGFVSNSSSSSFIIALREFPKSEKELKDKLFGNQKNIYYYDFHVNTDTAAKIIYNDLKTPATKEEICEELTSGSLDGKPDYFKFLKDYKFDSEEYKKGWEEYEKATKEFCEKVASEFLQKTQHHLHYIVEYSDNEGSTNIVLEHGDVFEKIPHIRISKH